MKERKKERKKGKTKSTSFGKSTIHFLHKHRRTKGKREKIHIRGRRILTPSNRGCYIPIPSNGGWYILTPSNRRCYVPIPSDIRE